MLTLHTADLLLPDPGAVESPAAVVRTAAAVGAGGSASGAAGVPEGAVLVDDGRIAALGPAAELAIAHPRARVRRWPGVITPGLRQWHGKWLLERYYYPDPREAHLLGTRPLGGAELGALEMDAERWAGSVRRGLQQMLRYGTTAVAGSFTDPVVRTAVARSGLVVLSPLGAPGVLLGEPDLDPFREGYDLAGTVHGPLVPGGRADLAVFDVPDEAALLERGAATCVATVLDGRLVHRRR